MIKRIFLAVLTPLFAILSKIYSYNVHLHFMGCRNRLYTLWLRNFLGELGENSYIGYPCSLQGGASDRIIIGNNTCIQSNSILSCTAERDGCLYNPTLKIGDNCTIGEYNHFTACGKIQIGDGLLTGRNVLISDNSHGGLSSEEAEIPPVKRKLLSKGEIKIGNNVWLGDRVTVLSGVTIGDNVIVGVGSVVLTDIPSNSIAVGAPAKVVKKL